MVGIVDGVTLKGEADGMALISVELHVPGC